MGEEIKHQIEQDMFRDEKIAKLEAEVQRLRELLKDCFECAELPNDLYDGIEQALED